MYSHHDTWVVHQERGSKTPHDVLCAAVYGTNNDDEMIRRVHSWRGVNQPNPSVHDTLKMFTMLFGGANLTPPAETVTVSNADAKAAAILQARKRVSVLDAVMTEYRSVMSEGSGHSASVRALISDHAETVRALELKAIDAHKAAMDPSGAPAPPSVGCKAPGVPAALDALKAETLEHWDKLWPVMVDLYVMALRCNLVRFGHLTYVAQGDMYPFAGFESAHRNIYHEWPKHAVTVQNLVKYKLDRIALFLEKMADPGFKESNGATLLDNTTLFFGSEISDTNSHSRTAMTYFLAGGQGRFRRGTLETKGRSDVTCTTASSRRWGSRDRLAIWRISQRRYRFQLKATLRELHEGRPESLRTGATGAGRFQRDPVGRAAELGAARLAIEATHRLTRLVQSLKGSAFSVQHTAPARWEKFGLRRLARPRSCDAFEQVS